MNTSAFLRHVAALVDAGLPDPIRVTPPFSGYPGQVQVEGPHVPAWADHLDVQPRWERGNGESADREFLACDPDPEYDVQLAACRTITAGVRA